MPPPPFGTLAHSNTTTPWTPEPPGRGTRTLLTTSLLTIALCAWTALHLNIPTHHTSSRQWLRKLKWFALGLAAPEVVVYVAWRQRREAGRVVGEGNSKGKGWGRFWGGSKRRGRGSGMVEGWSMVHGFYAVMGGFAFDCSGATEPFLPRGRTRVVLTVEGLRFLLHHEPSLLPPVTKAQIADKSKADGLKKFIVCAQAIWFVASSITRLANSLPISLLELNAMGHAACALCIYAMWWEKPLDVDEPTLVQVEKADLLLAYMWMGSRVGAEGLKSWDMHGWLRDEFDGFWMYEDPKVADLVFGSRIGPICDLRSGMTLPSDSATSDFRPGSDPIAYPLGHRHYSTASTFALRFRILKYLQSKPKLATFLKIRFPAGLGVRKTAIDHASPRDVARWKLAREAIEHYQLEDDVRLRHHDRSDIYDENSRVRLRIGNLGSLIGSRAWEVWFGFAVAGILYGGLHLLAWNAPFPSRVEQVCWRVAASSVTMTPLLLVPVALMFSKRRLGRADPELVEKTRNEVVVLKGRLAMFWFRKGKWFLFVPLLAAAPFLWLSYILGRVYLVVECFKNVGYLPKAVFEDVSWPAYLPHIS